MQQKAQSKALKQTGRKTAQKKPGVLAIALRMFVLGLLFIVFTGLILFGIQGYFQLSGRIVPGVWITDLNVSSLTRLEAAAAIEEHWNSSNITLVDSEDTTRTWSLPSNEIGLSINTLATADQAYSIGHLKAPHINLIELFLSLRNGVLLNPVPQINEETVRSHLTFLSDEVNIPPVEGEIRIENGQVFAVNGAAGRKIDYDNSIALLTADPLSIISYGFFPLIMQPWEPEIGDVTAAAAEVTAYLESDWQVRAYDPVVNEYLIWEPTAQQIGAWLQLSTTEGEYTISMDTAAYQQNLIDWAESINNNRVLDVDQALAAAETSLNTGENETLILTYLPTFWEVGAGETMTSISSQVGIPAWKILEANPSLSGTGLVRESSITIPPADINLELPVIPEKRIKISISEQHLWVYENQEIIRDYAVSTGIDKSPTLPGVFQVLMHEINAYGSRWDLYMPHFLGIYEALPGFTNGIHGLPMLSNGQRLWADVLGQPASYGCIILDLEAAEWLYEWAEDGVVVEIVR